MNCALQFGRAALVWGFSLLAFSFVLQTIALVLRLVQEARVGGFPPLPLQPA